MLKKSVLALVLGLSLSSLATAKPYIGLEYSHYDNDELTHDILGIVGGYQFNRYIGLEGFYGMDLNQSETVYFYNGYYEERADYSLSNYGFSLTGQYPITDALYVKGSAGVSWVTESIDFERDNSSYNKTHGGYFFGKLGIGYNFTPSISTELTYNRLDDLNGVGLNLKYKFN